MNKIKVQPEVKETLPKGACPMCKGTGFDVDGDGINDKCIYCQGTGTKLKK